MSTFFASFFNKVLIALPFLLVGFYVYGLHKEHEDGNVAGMYVIAFLPLGFITSIVCYGLYFLTDMIFKRPWNFQKYIIHLLLLLPIYYFLPTNGASFISILTVGIVLVVNICTLLYDKFIVIN